MRSTSDRKITVSAQIIKIATIAVALGMITMLLSIAFSRGLQEEIHLKLTAFYGDIEVSPFENGNAQYSSIPFRWNDTLKQLWTDNPALEEPYPFIKRAGVLKHDELFEGALFVGVDETYSPEAIMSFPFEGRFLNTQPSEGAEIVLSSTMANRLGLNIGDRFRAYFIDAESKAQYPKSRRLELVGIYTSGFPDIDGHLVFTSLGLLQQLNRWESDQIGGLTAVVKAGQKSDEVADQLYSRLPSHLDVHLLKQRFSSLYQWMALFDFNTWIIIVVMLLVGIVNIATALLVLILERSKMVGLLKAIGAPNNLLQQLFLWNGLLVMGRGLLWGNGLGLLMYGVQKYTGLIRLDPTTYFVEIAPVRLVFMDVLWLNIFVVLVSALCLWIPVKIVSKIAPAQVLKYA
ncbi:MAG: ABC transporter permease [Flavobacteriaceae bacterium]